jgi:hypothetical protein
MPLDPKALPFDPVKARAELELRETAISSAEKVLAGEDDKPLGRGRRKTRKSRKSRKTRSRRHRKGGGNCGM